MWITLAACDTVNAVDILFSQGDIKNRNERNISIRLSVLISKVLIEFKIFLMHSIL